MNLEVSIFGTSRIPVLYVHRLGNRGKIMSVPIVQTYVMSKHSGFPFLDPRVLVESSITYTE